jgi:hypothetical protein
LFGMTGIVATAVALRRNVAWRGYSAKSVIAAVAAFFFQFVLAFHQAPAMTSCATSKDMRGLEILNHRDRVLGRVSGYALPACTPAVRGRRPSPALHARRRARHRTSSRSLQHGSVGEPAAMPTVTWARHGEGRRARITSVGGSDHVRSRSPASLGIARSRSRRSGPTPEVKARFLMPDPNQGHSRHVRAGVPFARSKTGCL